VPVLLDFDNPAYDVFGERNRAHERAWSGLRRAYGTPRPGELLAQKTFSAEWEGLVGDELTFTYSHDEREEFIRLELGGQKFAATLDVGCGYGLEAALLARAAGGVVFGIDSNLALVRGAHQFRHDANVHLAIASAFAPPFERESFDLVYSHGVLHHTFDTKHAFDSIVRFVEPGGSVCIWVYALEDAQRGSRRRALTYQLELSARPRIANLPAWLQSAVVNALAWNHYRTYRKRGLKRDSWKFANSVHSMRDRWTPPYAHRHSFHEVISWFVEHGLTDYELLDPVRYREQLGRNLIGIAIRGGATRPAMTSSALAVATGR
jgi:SAM-dependent methyltransferase